MITFIEVYSKIVSVLTGHTAQTLIQVDDLEDSIVLLLNYVEQQITTIIPSASAVREAHASATAGVNCNLTWDTAFADGNYTYVFNGFDSHGNPVEIYLVSKSTTKIVIKTLVNCTINALAFPCGPPST